MRSTVSDSSGNPENREDPEYGEGRYGAVPVREWVGPEGVGSVTDAWAAAAERAGAPASGPGTRASDPGGRASGSRARASGQAEVRGVPVPGPFEVSGASADYRPAQVSGAQAGPSASGAKVSGPSAAGAESVVDLVLDLLPGKGERERRGAGFGAASASVSVPASVAGQAVEAAGSAPAREAAAPGPVVRRAAEAGAEAGIGAGAEAGGAGGQTGLRDAGGHVADLLPAPAPEAGHRAASGHEVLAVPEVRESSEVHAAPEAGETSRAHEVTEARDAPEAREIPEVSEAAEDRAVAPPSEPAEAPEAPESVPPPPPDPEQAPEHPGEDAGEFRTDAWGDADARVDTGRHQAVIANERTASIPVHLLFRQEPEAGADAAALPADVVRRAPGGEQPAGVRRAPVARAPQVRPSTRPSPVADPRLHERPGPSLPGWAALLTGFGGIAMIGAALWWTGALPARLLARTGIGPRPYDGLGVGAWAGLALLVTVVLFAFGGLSRGRVGYAWVLTLFGRYRGSVRRTGLMWVSPLLLRRRVDVRLRHWRSEPLPAMDANGTALRVVVLVVWRVKDTARATLGIEDHEEYLREQVEAAMARVLSQLPADAFHEDAHTLRNAEAVGDALTRMLKADCEPVGVEVYSAQPTGIEYAPEVAAAMQRRRIAAIDAKHRDSVLTSVVDAVDDTVNRLTARGLVELDDYERKSLVKDLTVAFYTGRTGGDGA
ncbi:SPFH domain-containing protein [Streptomyces sp. NPDC001743]|uniref:SPFH domain-containing protein n=1 Tax=Streptomyces sp. NPDC001743 TaxID=3154397 RepID=UPI00331E4A5A